MEVINIASYPLLQHYGSLCCRLSRREANEKTFDERFESIGRYVVGRVIRFYSKVLSREGKISYDPEDIFLELWAELKHRNPKYNQDVGSYLTFAQRIISNRLSELLESTHCVEQPSNAGEKFKELQRLASTGEITKDQRARFMALIAACVDHAPIPLNHPIQDGSIGPADAAIQNERRNLTDTAIRLCLVTLSVRECVAIGHSLGLWSREKLTMPAADKKYGYLPGSMGRALVNAKRKLRIACSNLQLDSSWF